MALTKSDLRNAPGLGIFTRGHSDQLHETNERDPTDWTTFRSKQPWRAAETALDVRSDNILVYICPIGEQQINYTAVLKDIHLYPEQDGEKTIELLQYQLKSHEDRGEELWEQYGDTDVKTLYAISEFKEVSEPFDYTELLKIDDNKPIAENYGYSYSICHQYSN